MDKQIVPWCLIDIPGFGGELISFLTVSDSKNKSDYPVAVSMLHRENGTSIFLEFDGGRK